MTLRVRVLVVIALAAAIAFVYLKIIAPKPAQSEALAYTECPFFGEPRVTVTGNVSSDDTLPVRKHEEVHAAQCRRLGPVRYRLKAFTAAGRLSVEAPSYCAGARARLAPPLRLDTALVRERLMDDVFAALEGRPDSASIRAALRASCPDIVH